MRARTRALRATIAMLLTAAVGTAVVPAQATPAPVITTAMVTNTNDAGPGSLREAIFFVNNQMNEGAYQILFNIPGGGVQVISPATDLPAVVGYAEIDGYSQPGSVPAAGGATAVLQVRIDATGLTRGLKMVGNGGLVTGLVISGADSGTGEGIRVEGDDNVIRGNYVGVTVNGEQPAGNVGAGVTVVGNGNTVGGSSAATRNVVSANDDGVLVIGDENVVAGNRIGTDDDGTTDLGNAGVGVEVQGSLNTVGGTVVGARNLLSANLDGVFLTDVGHGNIVRGNYIGTTASGNGDLGNSPGAGFGSSRHPAWWRTTSSRTTLAQASASAPTARGCVATRSARTPVATSPGPTC